MILGTGATKKHNPMGMLTPVLALLLCLCVSSWGACTSRSSTEYCSYGSCTLMAMSDYCPTGTTTIANLPCGGRNISINVISSGTCNNGYWNASATLEHCQLDAWGEYRSVTYNYTFTTCSTQAEADSVSCVSQGNTWVPEHQNSQGVTIPGKCQEPVQEDQETMEKLVSACDQLDGESNYQYNDKGNVVGYCNLCQKDENGNYTNTHVKEAWKEYQESCCQVGKAPSDKSFSCNASANACAGANCDWTITPGVKGGGIGYSDFGYKSGICEVNVTMSTDGVIAGCEDEEPNSSGSQNSSDSQEPFSSSSGSGEGEGSSASTEQQIADGVGAIIDSLHKIIVIDSMNRTYDSLVAVFASTIAATNDEINTKLDNIGNDTNIVNVNVQGDTNIIHVGAPDVDVQGMIDAIVASAAVDSQNGITLDSMLKCIADRGSSCFIGDTTQPYNDSNIVNILTDTSGQSYGDTAGWGAKFDSLGTWLKDSTILKNIFGSGNGALCDTTGGKKCASMGGSLDSAGGSWGSTYKALGDSLTGGAVGDSLRHWESMLTNNGVITGSGSNACPSVFSRQFEINIGQSISVQTPALGQYICANIPGTGVTFWTLARVVVRAMVAITCMWWLYGAVTGVKNDGGDDD